MLDNVHNIIRGYKVLDYITNFAVTMMTALRLNVQHFSNTNNIMLRKACKENLEQTR